MIEKFFKKIIQGSINTVNSLDLINENITKIRKEVKEFFILLTESTLMMNNLGLLIQSDFDRNNFVVYDEIMEIVKFYFLIFIFSQEGLKGIYDLFIDKIHSSVLQIVDKLRTNQKFSNAYNYFVKDFIFFYFNLKLFALRTETDLNIESTIVELEKTFIEKFSNSASENFTRAFSLVKNVEKTAEMNGRFQRENIVNVQILDHFVKYIKLMSMSFVDLNEEFGETAEILIKNDALISKLQNTFCDLLIECYFCNIFSKLDIVISSLNYNKGDTGVNNLLNVQKFYYFYYILYKMNEVFLSFLNSNIPFLISYSIQETLEMRMEVYTNQFYNCFLNRIAKEIKMLLINKDLQNL